MELAIVSILLPELATIVISWDKSKCPDYRGGLISGGELVLFLIHKLCPHLRV